MLRAVAVAAGLLVCTASLRGDERTLRMLGDWIDMVDRHAAGERDDSLSRIGDWSVEDLLLIRPYIEALTEAPLDHRARTTRRGDISRGDMGAIRELTKRLQARGTFDDFRKRAALLHTDAALIESAPRVTEPPEPRSAPGMLRRAPPTPGADVREFDGRVDHFQVPNPHWQIAMDLLDALPASPRRDPIVARWYRAIAARFASERNSADATRLFERARRVVPDDPGVLFADACLQENLGSPRVQNFVKVTKLPGGLIVLGVDDPPTHFRRAEAMLKRALAAQPDFVDARLRLGRILIELRQYEAALPHLARVVADSKDPALTFYAHLFSGDAALALERPAESRESFERALEIFPDAQSARLGLGAALRAAGNREQALAELMVTLTVPPLTRDAVDEPWWNYYEGDAANVDRLLQELRAPFTIATK